MNRRVEIRAGLASPEASVTSRALISSRSPSTSPVSSCESTTVRAFETGIAEHRHDVWRCGAGFAALPGR